MYETFAKLPTENPHRGLIFLCQRCWMLVCLSAKLQTAQLYTCQWKWVGNLSLFIRFKFREYLFNLIHLNFELGNEITGTACQRCSFAWLLRREGANFRHSRICQLRQTTNLSTKLTSWKVSLIHFFCKSKRPPFQYKKEKQKSPFSFKRWK